jgi:hypothetical protein
MNAISAESSVPAATRSSVVTRLLNLFVSPSAVFEEVTAEPSTPLNWLLPVGLVCLSGLAVLYAVGPDHPSGTAITPLLEAGKIVPEQATHLKDHWQTVSGTVLCLATLVGTVWSALVLWLVGRVILQSRFGFEKALEVAGLTGGILVLGGVVTALLIAATGDPSARPALSLLCPSLPLDSRLRAALSVCDVFHLWATSVLAIGLARLSGATVKEATFWVFGYWFAVRAAFVLLS